MRRIKTAVVALVCAAACVISGCGTGAREPSGSLAASNSDPLSALWEQAVYTEDCEIGSGAHSAHIGVKIGSRTVTITVNSNKTNLAEMLTESGLIEGETGAYGLYITRVNGVLADYDADKAFWSLQQGGVPTAMGVSSVTVTDGDSYDLVYTLADEDAG